MIWANFFHWHQPPGQSRAILEQVMRESYLPFVEFLHSHPKVAVTLNITASLTEQLHAAGMTKVLEIIKLLSERGQIELVGTAAYHIILPLLPDEFERQQTLNAYIQHDVFGFGYKPKGFFLPEMCWSKDIELKVAHAGYAWMILDEIAYDGTLGKVRFDQRYHSGVEQIGIVFRNRKLSNYLSFEAPIGSPELFWDAVHNDPRSDTHLVTAMDGENLGHHRKGVDTLWQTLVQDPRVTTVTMTAYRHQLTTESPCTPYPSSWSSTPAELEAGHPYALWRHPNNAVHTAQWDLTAHLQSVLATYHDTGSPEFAEARSRMDRALASDQYWWASCRPWWSTDMIIAGAQRLTAVAEPLSLSDRQKAHTAKLYDTLRSLVQQWQDTGIPAQLQEEYKNEHNIQPYLGGEKIIS